jgi:hypothetical protein
MPLTLAPNAQQRRPKKRGKAIKVLASVMAGKLLELQLSVT